MAVANRTDFDYRMPDTGASLGSAADAILRALPLVECSAVAPERCYCARGTTKPIAEINPAGAVLQVFCSGPEAIRLLVRFYLDIQIYMQHIYNNRAVDC